MKYYRQTQLTRNSGFNLIIQSHKQGISFVEKLESKTSHMISAIDIY